jgi:hypothetical protein
MFSLNTWVSQRWAPFPVDWLQRLVGLCLITPITCQHFKNVPVTHPACSTLRVSKLHELFNDRSFAGLLIRELDMVDERRSTLRIG